MWFSSQILYKKAFRSQLLDITHKEDVYWLLVSRETSQGGCQQPFAINVNQRASCNLYCRPPSEPQQNKTTVQLSRRRRSLLTQQLPNRMLFHVKQQRKDESPKRKQASNQEEERLICHKYAEKLCYKTWSKEAF